VEAELGRPVRVEAKGELEGLAVLADVVEEGGVLRAGEAGGAHDLAEEPGLFVAGARSARAATPSSLSRSGVAAFRTRSTSPTRTA